jgi:hypothetical protein
VASSEAARIAIARGRTMVQRRRRRRWLVPPLLAAAAAAVLILWPRDQIPPMNTPTIAASVAPPPIVEGGADRVAVIATRRPDLIVVWEF